MRGFERWFVLWSIAYMIVYVPLFLIAMAWTIRTQSNAFFYILPFHFLGMLQNFAALILTIRDLYLRPFSNPNDKLIWLLLILLTGGIGWIIYIFMYALKPRDEPFQRSPVN
jgi:hypothetical protein